MSQMDKFLFFRNVSVLEEVKERALGEVEKAGVQIYSPGSKGPFPQRLCC